MTKPKLLFLSQMFPYPPIGGGLIKTYQSLVSLAKSYSIYAVFVSETQPTQAQMRHLKKYCTKLKVFKSDRVLFSVKDNLGQLARNILQGQSHFEFQYRWEAAFPFIHQVIKSFKPQVIHVDHINLAQYLPQVKNQIWILESHNIECQLMWSRFIHTRKLIRKLYLLIETGLIYLFERHWVPKFDHIFTISQLDADRYKKLFSMRNIEEQRLVIQPKKWLVLPEVGNKLPSPAMLSPTVLFIGNLGWPPNEDAVEWFIEKIWPLVLGKIPNTKLEIVGKPKKGKWNIELDLPGVNWRGFVSDLDPYLKTATAFILPFRMGGGVRLKTLTALSASLPIVSTRVGVEGLPSAITQTAILADQANDFARQLIKLLRAPTAQQKMRIKSLNFIRTYHHAGFIKTHHQRYLQIVNRLK